MKRHYKSNRSGRELEADPRRKGIEDSYMLHEDRNAIANMPQEVIMRSYPKEDMYQDPGLDDTIRGVDKQISMGAKGKTYKKDFAPEMF